MRILVYGKDARTHALVESCAASRGRNDLYVYTQFVNPGYLARCKEVERGSLSDLKRMIQYALQVKPHLVIIGPEEPLEAGLVDALEEVGIPCFGPRKELAKLETSKSWTRRLLDKYRIPGNPDYRVFSSTNGMSDYLKTLGEFVMKPDGLTGGKGVRVSGEHILSVDEALSYGNELLLQRRPVVVEERLDGEEFSLQSICDGEHLLHAPVVQDHKRACETDKGPNTGGMGSYSCPDHSLPFLSEDDLAQAKSISAQVARALEAETGKPYRGVLYGGFMATRRGVKLLEYNARFGDPEAMNVLPILDGDFVELCEAVVKRELHRIRASFRPVATVCKYLVPNGYPTNPIKDEEIFIPESRLSSNNLRVFYAAVEARGDRIALTGSRAAAFLGIGETLEQAERLAESAASSIEGPVFHRRDIGTAALIEKRVNHVKSLRSAALSH